MDAPFSADLQARQVPVAAPAPDRYLPHPKVGGNVFGVQKILAIGQPLVHVLPSGSARFSKLLPYYIALYTNKEYTRVVEHTGEGLEGEPASDKRTTTEDKRTPTGLR